MLPERRGAGGATVRAQKGEVGLWVAADDVGAK